MLITSYGKYTQPIGEKKSNQTQKRILNRIPKRRNGRFISKQLGNKKFFFFFDNKILIFFEGERRMVLRITTIEWKYKVPIENQIPVLNRCATHHTASVQKGFEFRIVVQINWTVLEWRMETLSSYILHLNASKKLLNGSEN